MHTSIYQTCVCRYYVYINRFVYIYMYIYIYIHIFRSDMQLRVSHTYSFQCNLPLKPRLIWKHLGMFHQNLPLSHIKIAGIHNIHRSLRSLNHAKPPTKCCTAVDPVFWIRHRCDLHCVVAGEAMCCGSDWSWWNFSWLKIIWGVPEIRLPPVIIHF